MDRAQRAQPPPGASLSWLERLRDWRHRTVAKPAFQRWAAAFPLTRPIARRDAREVFDLVAGFVYSQVLLACVRLNVFEHLADGALAEDELATRLGLNAEGTERLIAAAVSLQLLERRDRGRGGRIGLGRLGAPLVGNRAVLSMIEHHATLYADLADPVALLKREGRPSMAGYWAYAAPESGSPAALSGPLVEEYSTSFTPGIAPSNCRGWLVIFWP